jgi:hypothetical protein
MVVKSWLTPHHHLSRHLCRAITNRPSLARKAAKALSYISAVCKAWELENAKDPGGQARFRGEVRRNL